MDTLRESMGLLWRLGIGMIFITFIWFIISAMYPNLSVKNLFSFAAPNYSLTGSTTKTKSGDWLPAPRNFNGIFGSSTITTGAVESYSPTETYGPNQNQYITSYLEQPGYKNTNGDYNYITYTNERNTVQTTPGGYVSVKNPYPDPVATTSVASQDKQATVVQQEPKTQSVDEIRSLYVRNLSIYPKVMIGKNLTFTGEAREVMFSKSGSFPLVIIDNQGRVGVIGIAQATSDWAIPGWVRFKATINATLPKNVSCTLIFESSQVQVSTGKPLRFPYNVTCNG